MVRVFVGVFSGGGDDRKGGELLGRHIGRTQPGMIKVVGAGGFVAQKSILAVDEPRYSPAMKRNITDLLIQIISVTIGVFLGFMVSNWSENSKEQRRYEALVSNIKAEITENKNRVLDVLPYHEMLRDSMGHALRSGEPITGRSPFFKGVRTTTFVNSAFETGVQTGLLNKMSLDQLQTLTDLYAQQRSYEDFTMQMMAGMLSMNWDGSASRQLYTFLGISMTDVVIKEGRLLESYEEALANFDS